MSIITLLKLKLQGRTWKVDGIRVIDARQKGTLIVIKK